MGDDDAAGKFGGEMVKMVIPNENKNPMLDWSPKIFAEYILEQFYDAKKKRLSRMSIEWGMWSREMNLVLRSRMESKSEPIDLVDPDDETVLRLKYVMVYWTLISQLLELYFQGSLLRAGKIKRKRKEADEILKIILTGNGLKELKLDAELTKRMLG